MNLDPIFNKLINIFSSEKETPELNINDIEHILKRKLTETPAIENIDETPQKLTYKLGDLNNDGKVDFDDVLILKDVLDGKRKLTEEELLRADLNQDGEIDYKDLNMLIDTVIESKRAEDRVMGLQGRYDELQTHHEDGTSASPMELMKINTVKAELEQAIADFILKSHKQD